MKFKILIFLSLLNIAFSAEVRKLQLTPGPWMDRAELYYIKSFFNPKAVLVLCPGVNGSGEGLIRSSIWQEFAEKNHLGLVGLSFASPNERIKDGSGYYYASNGSGEKLLEGIRKIYGRDLPLLLYGFSGGAHFTSRFEEWRPESVLAWCAYSAAWWDTPCKSVNPPGIIACGDQDERYGASLAYFKKGRSQGKAWLWISLPQVGHEGSSALDDFVRKYFSVILSNPKTSGVWIDIDAKKIISSQDAEIQPSTVGWLPSKDIFKPWEDIHEP